ncbi:Oxysterol-binding protein-related protein 9 [Trichinella zimbabwensis]|uniref:Oxysterol-binding protein n=1 Tax=Trichinella zimbabwensis TaxID=268475 RepID=A0A0V1GXV7_9BILA|nr:Oxysterol-binding protein-related protein 9 [Trichinella zimbabwensis]
MNNSSMIFSLQDRLFVIVCTFLIQNKKKFCCIKCFNPEYHNSLIGLGFERNVGQRLGCAQLLIMTVMLAVTSFSQICYCQKVVIMEGPLSKWTNVIEGWQFRLFVLDETAGTLSYYTSQDKMKKGQVRGCVRLKGAVVGIDDEDDCTFTITVDQKMFHFQAKDYEERDRWIAALEKTIQEHSDIYRYRFKHTNVGVARSSSSYIQFEKRIAQVDTYLQMVIDRIQHLEGFVADLKPEEESGKISRIIEIANEMLDSVKHSVVLLQYAKNEIVPEESRALVEANSATCGEQKLNAGRLSNLEPSQNSGIKPSLEEKISGDNLDHENQLPPDSSLLSTVENVQFKEEPILSYSKSDEEDELYYDSVEQMAMLVDDMKIESCEGEMNNGTVNQLNNSSAGEADDFPYVVHMEPQFTDPEVNFDMLYADDMEDELEDTREHGSVIMHLLSQLSVGMDLTKIVLPTYILERRSLLEMYADFMSFPDLFERIADCELADDRMLAVVRWYLSTFYGGRRSGLAKKPYNPILGEVFACCWNSPSVKATDEKVADGPVPTATVNQITFVGEQVSHHPPVSAFYVEHPSKKLQLNGHIWTKSKFLGLSIAVHNVGQTCLSVLERGEEYLFDFPNGYGRSILTTPWVEFGGKCSIRCEKTSYHADVEFSTKTFYSGKAHCLKVEVYRPAEKSPYATIRGQWNGVMHIKTNQTEEVFLDVRKLDPTGKLCRPIGEQKPNESRRLWRHVTAALKDKDVHRATRCKFWLEQKQRDAAARRALANVPWKPKLFEEVAGGWMYYKPLSKRERFQRQEN